MPEMDICVTSSVHIFLHSNFEVLIFFREERCASHVFWKLRRPCGVLANLFARVNLTCLKYSQVENVDFCVVLPRTYGSNKNNSVFSCIHSLRKVFHKFFKDTFWTIVPFLLKRSFFLTVFSPLEILLEHMGPKMLSPVPVN